MEPFNKHLGDNLTSVAKGDNLGMVNDLEFEAGSIFVLNFFPTGAGLAPVALLIYFYMKTQGLRTLDMG